MLFFLFFHRFAMVFGRKGVKKWYKQAIKNQSGQIGKIFVVISLTWNEITTNISSLNT